MSNSSDLFYLKPLTTVEATIEVKKSRFLVSATPTTTPAQARTYIQKIKAATPSANHHCSAFIIGSPQTDEGFGYSDDGEPAGTAGKPMYQVINGNNIGDICIVVTRFFGGIKLGTGGLARAYADSVKTIIPLLDLEEVQPLCQIKIAYPYPLSAAVDSILHNSKASLIDSQYSDTVMLLISLPINETDALIAALQERCSGKVNIEKL